MHKLYCVLIGNKIITAPDQRSALMMFISAVAGACPVMDTEKVFNDAKKSLDETVAKEYYLFLDVMPLAIWIETES